MDASSGPSGQDATGRVRLGFGDGEFRGFVTCLDMRGYDASMSANAGGSIDLYDAP